MSGRRGVVLSSRAGLVCLGLSSACGPGDAGDNAPPITTQPTSGSADDTGGTADGTTGSATGDGSTTGGEGNCGGVTCTGHGACEMTEKGSICVCDEFYALDDESGECIVDETCVEVRYLEDRCRQIFNGAPAVSLFFAVDFCAGTALLPEDKERLGLEFLVLEDGIDIAENVESFSTIIDTSVESYVTLSIDLSDSVTDDENLDELVTELRAFVEGLAPGPDDPDLYVSVDVFARDVVEYVTFTRDLGAVDAALAAIASDPAPIVLLAGGGQGTDLYDAVEVGIERTQRARDLRDAVTWGGVLTTGTVVLVTDGNDSSGGTLDTGLIAGTTNQVISVGISEEIEDADLQAIGRDGSFLAPEVEDWAATFSEIRDRIAQYPERSYLLAYCSSLTEGNPQVQVKVQFPNGDTTDAAACDFAPDYFSIDPLDTCTPALFANECESIACGGITACGACADDECCDGGGSCTSPQSATQAGMSCDDQNELCYVEGDVCPEMIGTCQPPAGLGDPCDGANPCEPGVGFCAEKSATCEPTIGLGELCGDTPEQCVSLHCDQTNPDNPLDVKVCQSAAEMYDTCGDLYGECEIGTYCQGSTCAPRLREIESCSEGSNCRRGQCVMIESGGKICNAAPVCFWAWDQKFPT